MRVDFEFTCLSGRTPNRGDRPLLVASSCGIESYLSTGNYVNEGAGIKSMEFSFLWFYIKFVLQMTHQAHLLLVLVKGPRDCLRGQKKNGSTALLRHR